MSVGATESNVTERSVPPAVVCALPAISLIEKLTLGAIVTAPWPLATTVIVRVEPEPVIVGVPPFVTVKSLAVIVAPSSVSLPVSVNAMLELLAGSAWPVACCRVSVGATESNVTLRSAPPAVVAALPAISLTEKPPASAIVTAPWPLATTVMVRVEPEPVIVGVPPFVTVKSDASIVPPSSDSVLVRVKLIDAFFVGSD